MAKQIILPAEVGVGNLMSLELPRGVKRFIISESGLYLIKKLDYKNSIILDQNMLSDSNLEICHKFDPIWLVLPKLLETRKYFASFLDILDGKHNFLDYQVITEGILKICDVKHYEGDMMIRINMDKYDSWIERKLECLTLEMMKNVPFACTRESALNLAYNVIHDFLDDNTMKTISGDLNKKYLAEGRPSPSSGNSSSGQQTSASTNNKEEKKSSQGRKPSTKMPKPIPKDKNQRTISSFFSKN